MSSFVNFLSKLLANPLSYFNLPNFQIYQLSFFAILIFVLIALRVGLSVAGRKYSTLKLFTGPVFLVLLVTYNYYNSYLVSLTLNLSSLTKVEVLLVPFLVALGIAAGHRLARNDRVYIKKGAPHYSSSAIISLVWALSFLIRMGIITYLPLIQVSVAIFSSVVLDIATGLILGESLKIYRTYRRNFSGADASPA
ncbi:hypothetical protein IX51_07665 [uncultured archaeon]|nr:hypothetical protein IX51_07665 [uncultured archaeon]